MATVHSYLRYSTPEQSHGDSQRRQIERARTWARENGYDFKDSYRHEGSGFRGKQRQKGGLKRFLDDVKAGAIPQGDLLYVESFDRLSREEPFEAFDLFKEIINSGVPLVVRGEVYTREKIRREPHMLYTVLGEMMRAHSESLYKSERLSEVNENKRRLARDTNRPLTSLCPGWMRIDKPGRGFEGASYKLVDEYTPIIYRIFNECIAGLGKRRIAERLNCDWKASGRKQFKPFRGKDGWHSSTISKILTNKAVLGVYQPHRKVDGKRVSDGLPEIEGYFPAVLEGAAGINLFYAAQAAIAARNKGSAGQQGFQYSNLFKGLGWCAECGGKLRYIDKGPAPKGGKYLRCERSTRGLCKNKTGYRYDLVETFMLQWPGGTDALVPEIPDDTDNRELARVAELEASVMRLTDARRRFFQAFGEQDDPMALDEIRRLGVALKEAETELVEARKAAKIAEYTERLDYMERAALAQTQLSSTDPDERLTTRLKLAAHFRATINRIVLHEGGDRITVEMPGTKIALAELTLRSDGEMDFYLIRCKDGRTIKFNDAVLSAAIAPLEAAAQRRLSAMRSDPTQAALGEMELLTQAYQPDDVWKRLRLVQVGPDQFEAQLRHSE